MMNGELSIISGLTFFQKIQMKFLPFISTRRVLKMIRKGQEMK